MMPAFSSTQPNHKTKSLPHLATCYLTQGPNTSCSRVHTFSNPYNLQPAKSQSKRKDITIDLRTTHASCGHCIFITRPPLQPLPSRLPCDENKSKPPTHKHHPGPALHGHGEGGCWPFHFSACWPRSLWARWCVRTDRGLGRRFGGNGWEEGLVSIAVALWLIFKECMERVCERFETDQEELG
jgi:hypothetical protein